VRGRPPGRLWTYRERSTKQRYLHVVFTSVISDAQDMIAELLIFKTHADKKSWAQPHAYEAYVTWFPHVVYSPSYECFSWEKGQATGDENVATESLRRFFEQHFHESNDSYVSFCCLWMEVDWIPYSGVRQHALLNLVRMHYIRNEYVVAQKVSFGPLLISRVADFAARSGWNSYYRRPLLLLVPVEID
jgi:hypothetical protein